MKRFFCDESGNSGSNYLDEHQPYYVISGFLEPRYNYELDENYFDDFIKINEEVKSIDVINEDINKVIDNLQKIINIGYTPFCAVVDKKFAMACRLSHLVFDYDDYRLVDFIYDYLDDNLLFEFTDAYLNTFKLYNGKIKTELDICLHKILKKLQYLLKKIDLIQNIKPLNYELIKEHIEYEFDNRNLTEKNKIDKSPNYFAFGSLLSVLAIFATKTNEYIEIFHDETDGFDKAFKRALSDLQDNPDEYYPEYDYKRIKSIDFYNSNDLIQIQLADHLSGILNYFLKNYKNSRLNNKDDIKLNAIKKFINYNICFYKKDENYNSHLMLPSCWQKELDNNL